MYSMPKILHFIWCDLRVVIVLRLKIEDIVVVKEDIEIICQEESRNII